MGGFRSRPRGAASLRAALRAPAQPRARGRRLPSNGASSRFKAVPRAVFPRRGSAARAPLREARAPPKEGDGYAAPSSARLRRADFSCMFQNIRIFAF